MSGDINANINLKNNTLYIFNRTGHKIRDIEIYYYKNWLYKFFNRFSCIFKHKNLNNNYQYPLQITMDNDVKNYKYIEIFYLMMENASKEKFHYCQYFWKHEIYLIKDITL